MTDEGVLRRELAAQLAERCHRHHLVVWDDPAQQYDGVVESVIPEGWELERYTGSWWDLRRRIESPFSAPTPPKLVVYVPAPPLPADPLAEVRQAAGSYKRLLPTLLREALAADVGATRLAELAEKCPTMVAAEDALAGGASLDPLLVAATGAQDAEAVIAAVLVGTDPAALAGEGVLEAIIALCAEHVGARLHAGGEYAATQQALARHLVLAEVARVLGDAAVLTLKSDWTALTPQQGRNVNETVERLGRFSTLAEWGALADQAATTLRLHELAWDDRLAVCDAARCIDELAFTEAAQRLVDDPAGARALVTRRIQSSRWLRWRDDWSGRALADLEAIRAVARLRLAVDANPVAAVASLGALYEWYAAGAWEVDRAHRLMEASRYGLARPGLDKAFTAARDAYLKWLDQVLTATSTAAAANAEVALPRQADVYHRHVGTGGRVALVIADAMRLEIGHRLSELVKTVAAARVDACVAAVPTVTRVGMANLLPAAASEGLGLRLESDQIVVDVGGTSVRTVADRTSAYRAAAGRVEDHQLSEWSSLGDDVLAQRVADADLLVVRSQEIDGAGEAGLAAVRWSQIDAAVDTIAILISRLAAAGVTKVVVTADHGFLALGRPLDPSRTRVAPSGVGVVQHGRAWIGSPATVPDGCTALPLSAFSIRSAESIVVPDGMTVFGAAGAGFFHGGISPQEVLIPVVELDLAAPQPSSSDYMTIDVSVPGGRISAEAFSIRVALAGSLFASEVAVRITATAADGEQVARLVPGESVDAHAGTVQLDPTAEAVLTFLVTQNLDKGSAVAISVLDAATGRKLSTAHATVAKDLRPEEEW